MIERLTIAAIWLASLVIAGLTLSAERQCVDGCLTGNPVADVQVRP